MEFLLFMHIVGVVLFLGNIIITAFWKIQADQTGNRELIHSAAKNVMLADFVFTIPGLLLIITSGVWMAVRTGYLISGFNWLTLSLILFVLTGVLWAGVLLPLQRKMIRLSAQTEENEFNTEAYRRVSWLWMIFGTIATLLPVLILYLMIGKGFF
ncbi:MAG: hypothetical protein C6W54_00585 [Bacillaceae bacterium]|nr:MAG: hypothetical protein C6W54_00585 [Bacillaceae bacterium]